MKDDFSLPSELDRLERALAARERPQLAPQAKQRLLCSVRAEVCRAKARSRWAFAVAMAATVLVWLNLSWSATQSTDCRLTLDDPRPPLEDGAEQIRQLLPELTPREAMRQSVLLRAGTRVVPCPRLSAANVVRRENDVWKELMN